MDFFVEEHRLCSLILVVYTQYVRLNQASTPTHGTSHSQASLDIED